MTKKIAVINSQSPFNTPAGRESLDLALIFGAFEQQVSVFFIDDGVYQLIKSQQPEQIGGKDFLATMKAFELYDIENTYCCEHSIAQRSIDKTTLIASAVLLTPEKIAQQLATFDHVVMQ